MNKQMPVFEMIEKKSEMPTKLGAKYDALALALAGFDLVNPGLMRCLAVPLGETIVDDSDDVWKRIK